MSKPQVHIHDVSFAHGACSAHNNVVTSFDWYRGQPQDDKVSFFTDMCLHEIQTSKAKRKIAWLIEPPVINPHTYQYIISNHHLYDYVLTHSKELINLVGPKALYYPMGAIWTLKENCGLKPKTKLVSGIFSNKNYAPGHQIRHEVVTRYPNKIDLFGRGYKEIPEKDEALNDYMFSFAILNCNMSDYFTDILLDPIVKGCVPIFWGFDGIEKYLNPDGILQFKTWEELDKIMESLTPELYYSKLEAIKENIERAEEFRTAEDYIYKTYQFLFND